MPQPIAIPQPIAQPKPYFCKICALRKDASTGHKKYKRKSWCPKMDISFNDWLRNSVFTISLVFLLLATKVGRLLGLVDSGTGGLLERNSFSINIIFTKTKIKK